MNGGVLHCLEVLSERELEDSLEAYLYFRLEEAAALLSQARALGDPTRLSGGEADRQEKALDERYWALIGDGQVLEDRFETRLSEVPSDFAPT